MMFEIMPFGYGPSMLDRFFGDSRRPGKQPVQFKTDILDKGDSFVLQAELPGFAKEDIHIDVQEGVLTISAKHQEEKVSNENGYVHRERSYGEYARSFDIAGIQEDNIGAKYENGVLELTLPKVRPVEPPKRQIAIQ